MPKINIVTYWMTVTEKGKFYGFLTHKANNELSKGKSIAIMFNKLEELKKLNPKGKIKQLGPIFKTNNAGMPNVFY